MTKMTNVKALDFVLTNCEVPQEVADKLMAMKTSYEKKASADRKPTPTQLENQNHKAAILAVLADLSNQRVSAIVRQLTLSGEVVRIEDKRKAYFKLAE